MRGVYVYLYMDLLNVGSRGVFGEGIGEMVGGVGWGFFIIYFFEF